VFSPDPALARRPRAQPGRRPLADLVGSDPGR
jgi:hypothetical protein